MSGMNRRRPDGEQLIGVLIPRSPPAVCPPPSGRATFARRCRPGRPIRPRLGDHALVVRTAAAGNHTVGARGNISLPAPHRQMSGIDIATTVILIAAATPT